MITRSLLVVVAVLLFASPAFTQFGQSNNNRLTDLAARLSREAGEFADDNYSGYVNGTRNLRRRYRSGDADATVCRRFANLLSDGR